MLEVKPNRGHELLAAMEKNFNVAVITQNVDNLHERAGSSHIIHLHGELTKVCSSRDPYNPHYIKELKPEEYEVKMGDKAGDGTQLRPFIVWFGEAVPEIETAIRYVEKADIFVIIGTSLNVYPAAGLLHYVPDVYKRQGSIAVSWLPVCKTLESTFVVGSSVCVYPFKSFFQAGEDFT